MFTLSRLVVVLVLALALALSCLSCLVFVFSCHCLAFKLFGLVLVLSWFCLILISYCLGFVLALSYLGLVLPWSCLVSSSYCLVLSWPSHVLSLSCHCPDFALFCLGLAEQAKVGVRVRVWLKVWVGVEVQLRGGGTFWGLRLTGSVFRAKKTRSKNSANKTEKILVRQA